jgi:tetratricopeptide (TPR) repeat protein
VPACARALERPSLRSPVFLGYLELVARYRAGDHEAAVAALLAWPAPCAEAARAALRFAYSLDRGVLTCDPGCLRTAVVLQTEAAMERRKELRRHSDADLEAARRLLLLEKTPPAADPFRMRWFVLAGSLLAEALRYPDALDMMEQARRAGRGIVLPLVAMASLHQEAALTGISTARKEPDARRGALVSLRTRETRKAEEALRAALRIDGANEEAHLRLGFARLLLGDGQEAWQELLRVLEEGSDAHHMSNARLLLGTILDARGRTQEAMDHYAGVARGLPDQRTAHLALGAALLRAGDRPAAQAAARAALSVESADRDAWIRFRLSHSVRAQDALAALRESLGP